MFSHPCGLSFPLNFSPCLPPIYCIISLSTLSARLYLSAISYPCLSLFSLHNRRHETPSCPTPVSLSSSFSGPPLSLLYPASKPSFSSPSFWLPPLCLSSLPSQRLIHSRMALFPLQPSNSIKIQNGQLNPSSISDLIVMVLPPVPGRPLLPRQASLYDTKWPGYNFSIYSKNSVNNSFGMSRRDSPGWLWPGLTPQLVGAAIYWNKMQGWIANVKG